MIRRTRSFALAVVVAILALGAVTACGSGDDGNAPTVYTRSDTRISVAIGDEFVIRLASNPTTGYEWSLTETVPEVRLVTTRYDAPKAQIPGRGGHQEFRFAARTRGNATLELGYARSFEPDVPPAETATFELRVG